MTRAIDVSALLLLLAMGCHRNDAVANEEPRAPTGSTTTFADASLPPSEAGAPSGSGPYARLAPIAMGAEGYAGFSNDDRYLGYEISTCETCPEEFHFAGPGVPELSFKYFYDPTLSEDVREKRQKANDAEVDRKLAALGVQQIKDGRVLRGPFPYPDLTFAVKSSSDMTTGKVTLHFGARVGAAEPVYPIRIALGPGPLFLAMKEMMDEPVLAYANVSKDGNDIGVVALARGPGWHEAGGVARMSVAKFVSSVYAETKSQRDAGP